jgi:ATP-dependent DNA helicase RecQ
LREFIENIDDDSTYEDLLEFIEELAQKDDGQLSKLYYNHAREVVGNDNLTEIILTTMHKVKGIEFDAVLIPSSFSNLPLNNNEFHPDNMESLRDLIEE